MQSVFQANRWTFFIIFIISLINIPYIFNNHFYWESLLYSDFIHEHDFTALIKPWSQDGRPLFAYLYYFIGDNISHFFSISQPFAFHWLILLAYINNGLLVFFLVRKYLKLESIHAFFIVLYMSLYPALESNINFAVNVLTFGLSALLWGYYFALKNTEQSVLGREWWITRLSACLFLLVSCISEATIFLVGVLPVIIAIKEERISYRSFFFSFRYRLDYLVIPIAYLFVMFVFFKTSGNYANEKNIDFNPVHFFLLFLRYLKCFFPITNDFHINGKIAVAILLSGGFFYLYRRKKIIQMNLYPKVRLLYIVGSAWFVLGVLPMLLAHRAIGTQAWGNRHFMLVGGSAGMLIVATLMMLMGGSRRKFLISAVMVAILLLVRILGDYFVFESRGAINDSLQLHFKKKSQLKNASIVLLNPLPSDVFLKSYCNFEWEALLHHVYGGYGRMVKGGYIVPGSLSGKTLKDQLESLYRLQKSNGYVREVNLSGSAVKMFVQLHVRANAGLGVKAMWKYWMDTPVQYNNWVSAFTTVQVKQVRV